MPFGEYTVGQTEYLGSKDEANNPVEVSSWESSHPTVGTVNSSGLFTAVGEGLTTITARDASDNVLAREVIRVIAASAELRFRITKEPTPVNTVPPEITGTALSGQTLSASTGTWTSGSTPTYTYQWYQDNTPISGATSSTYLLTSGDEGSSVKVQVTATNTEGGTSAFSLPTETVAFPAPVNTVLPEITGTATSGETLSASTGTWTSGSVPTYAYQWYRDTNVISGANSSTYVLTAGDVGSTVKVKVTASNTTGSTAAYSVPTDTVAAPAPSYAQTLSPGADLNAAIASASNGDNIRLSAGTYTLTTALTVGKSVRLVGDGIGQTILTSAGTSGDPVSLINVTTDNVLFKDMTIKHLKTSNTSVEAALTVSGSGFPQTRVAGFQMDGCRIEYMEFGVTIRGSGWKIVNSQFHYTGGTNSTRRAIGVYGNLGNTFVNGNAFTDNGSSGSQRAIQLTSTTGTNPNETYEGTLSVENNTFTGGQTSLAQFYNQDSFQAGVNPFNLVVKGNTTQETSAFVVVFGGAANFGNIFGNVTVANNSLSGSHGGSPVGTKGAFAIDGTAAFRSSALPFHTTSNTLTTTTTYRTGWNALSGTDAGYATALGSVPTATVDSTIPASLTPPATYA